MEENCVPAVVGMVLRVLGTLETNVVKKVVVVVNPTVSSEENVDV
jgi:hypothetical protein